MISQVELIAAICTHLGNINANSRQMNAIIEAANLVVDAFNNPHQPATSQSGLAAWLASDETGASSMYLAHTLSLASGGSGVYCKWGNQFPYDSSDFGRCVGLLEAVPEFRRHLSMMAGSDHGPVWNAIVREWHALETLYKKSSYLDLDIKLLEIRTTYGKGE